VFRHQPLFYLHPFWFKLAFSVPLYPTSECTTRVVGVPPPTTLLFTPLYGSNLRFLFHFSQQANASPVWLVFRHQPLSYFTRVVGVPPPTTLLFTPVLVQTCVFCSTLSNKRMHHPCGWCSATNHSLILPVWLVFRHQPLFYLHPFWFKLAFSVPLYPTSECITRVVGVPPPTTLLFYPCGWCSATNHSFIYTRFGSNSRFLFHFIQQANAPPVWLVFRHQPLFYLHPCMVQTCFFCSTLSNKRMH
jgi:hypothetical protein